MNLSFLKGKVIAIDGPAGAGKSTTARLLAERLGYTYLDTGAMYRAITCFALNNDIKRSDEVRLSTVANQTTIRFQREDGLDQVFINNIDVTKEIRSPEVTKYVSEVAAHQGVRQAMVKLQQQLAAKGSIVAEGRDTTTVVFPDADLKIYLDASVRQRAERRLLDMTKMDIATTLEEQEQDIIRRDKFDSGREHSPLTRADDARHVDTTNLTIEGQVDYILRLILSEFGS